MQLLRLGYLADIFSKMYKVKLLSQGKQQTIFFSKDKIQASSEDKNSVEHIYHYGFGSFSILTDFSDEIGDFLMWYNIMAILGISA